MPIKGILIFLKIGIVLLSILIVGCASAPEPPAPSSVRATPKPVVAYALSLRGKPYRYGKESPQEGFDCSGFVRHVYRQQGVLLPRTSREMAIKLPPVPKNAIQSGDLLFFNIDGKVFSHVGIYINNDNFIHSPSQRTGKVTVSSLKNNYWQKRFMGIRRPPTTKFAN